MSKISQNLRLWTALLTAGIMLSACSTVSKVTDAINPFDGSSKNAEIKTDPARISILSLNDKLEVAGTMAPSDIVLPQVYTNPDWPQSGGYATHAPQRTNAPGDLSKLWSRGVGKGSYRKGG